MGWPGNSEGGKRKQDTPPYRGKEVLEARKAQGLLYYGCLLFIDEQPNTPEKVEEKMGGARTSGSLPRERRGKGDSGGVSDK